MKVYRVNFLLLLFLIGLAFPSYIILIRNSNEIKKNENNNYLMRNNIETVVCLVLTRPRDIETKASVIYKTWGKRCDKIYFAASTSQEFKNDIPIIYTDSSYETNDSRFMSKKLFEALKKLNKLVEDFEYEWIFITDDDTYVIVENLKYFINEVKIKYSHEIYTRETYGYNFDNFHSGGAGILFHRNILKEFVNNYKIKCFQNLDGPGDLMLSTCLKQMNINLGKSRDNNNMDRFLPLPLNQNWINNENQINCCSERIISMHYINENEMIKIDTLLYKIKVFKN